MSNQPITTAVALLYGVEDVGRFWRIVWIFMSIEKGKVWQKREAGCTVEYHSHPRFLGRKMRLESVNQSRCLAKSVEVRENSWPMI